MTRNISTLALRASALGAIALLCAAGGDAPRHSDAAAGASFIETKWPFPIDQWGLGKAYECPPVACGARLRLYVRAKIGFCDCSRGVADDQEVDRVVDLDLISPTFEPAGEGRPIGVGRMAGRVRDYSVRMKGATEPAKTFAFAANCNVAVATLTGGTALSDAAEEAALDFLNGKTIVTWAKNELGS